MEVLILTAARSGEIRGATWSEFDLDKALWSIPATRMKLKTPMSDMALLKILRDMATGATVHGFRSAFRDWVADMTSYPGEVAEAALAHANSNKVEAAYRRTDFLEKRKTLMAEWAVYCGGG